MARRFHSAKKVTRQWEKVSNESSDFFSIKCNENSLLNFEIETEFSDCRINQWQRGKFIYRLNVYCYGYHDCCNSAQLQLK
mgnify:CR=1 FL=1